MSKGDIFDPAQELAASVVARVLFPRAGGYQDELSWQWLVGVAASVLAAIATRRAWSAPGPEETVEHRRHRLRLNWGFQIAAWACLCWSLFFFRFGRLL